jgi:hypothetical protein
MEKLTQEQVNAVDKALWDIGIKFLDIRIEMTDHAATAIEGMEGSFTQRLNTYFRENKQELKKNYSQFRTNASIKAVKLLFWNMLSFRFVAILALAYASVFAVYKYEGPEETSFMFLMIFLMSMPVILIYSGHKYFTRQTKLFSTAERLLAIVWGLGFSLWIPLRTMIEKDSLYDGLILLYYAFIISLYVMTIIIYRFLTKFYKSRYKVA